MDKFENYIKIKCYLVNKNIIDLTVKANMLRKVCQT